MKYKLKTKISFIVVLSIIVSAGLLGVYFDRFLKAKAIADASVHLQDVKEKINLDFKTNESSLKDGLNLLDNDAMFLASISLINTYQDTHNYNSILLDEEKKNLAQMLLKQVKISFNNAIALYDKDGVLTVFVNKEAKGYRLNFISYENNKMVLYSKTESQESYAKTPLSNKVRYISLKHLSYYTQPELVTSIPITRHFLEDNALYVVAHKSIFDGNVTLAHIEMSNKIDNQYLTNVAKNFDIHCYFTKDISSIDTKNKSEIFESKSDYFTLLHVSAKNANLGIVISLDKSSLNKALKENREDMMIYLFVILFFTLGFLYLLFERVLSRPLAQLMQNIVRIGNGDYSHVEIISTGDEFEEISWSIQTLQEAVNTRETKLLEAKNELKFLSDHDDLTNLYNRRAFKRYFSAALLQAKKNNTQIAMLLFDLDGFKQVNDTLSHKVGDMLLVEVAKRVSSFLGNKGIIARMGGDEFELFIEDCKDTLSVEEQASALLKLFEEAFTCNDFEIHATVSIGVALYPEHGEDDDTLIKNADLAMYASKAKGGNQASFYSAELLQKTKERLDIIEALRYAIKNPEEFTLLYQPKTSIKTGKIVAVEALIRWKSKTLGFVRPDQFIKIAEDTHMIIDIGKWVLNRACTDFMDLKKCGCKLEQMSVNLSSVQLLYSDIHTTVLEAIRASGIQSSELELEITESYIAANAQEAIESLRKFRDLGIDLAIDDFGTGYSSMSYLQKLPVTRLKIDKSFVDELPYSKESIAIATAIMALASTFGLKITVEGVETREQLEFFKDKYCDEIQGYYYSKPLDFEALQSYIKNSFTSS
jgi:diguanylate cyclase (GGDEF)-like protein